MFRMGCTTVAILLLPLSLAGQWYVDTTKDAMTDEVTSRITTLSLDSDSDSPTTLNWACDSEGMLVYLVWGEYLGGNFVQVQYRFDSKPASPIQDWELSERVVIAPDEIVAEFTAQARTAAKVLIRVAGSGETATHTFDLDGSLTAKRRAETREVFRTKSFAPDSMNFNAALNKQLCIRTDPRPTGRTEGLVYTEALVEERPERLTGPGAQYPDLLREAGVSGRVLVQGVIDTTGRAIPNTVRVVESPHPGFDEAAKRVMLQSLFRPGRVGGRAVKVLVTLPVDFTFKK